MNIMYSLSYRRQSRLCLRLAPGTLGTKFLYQGDDIASGTTVLLENLLNCEILLPHLEERNLDIEILKIPKVIRYETMYAPEEVI